MAAKECAAETMSWKIIEKKLHLPILDEFQVHYLDYWKYY